MDAPVASSPKPTSSLKPRAQSLSGTQNRLTQAVDFTILSADPARVTGGSV